MSHPQFRNRHAAPGHPARVASAIIFISAACLAVAHRPAEAAAVPRLGHAVVPTFESIRLALDPAKPSYTGTVRIELSARERTGSFVFHARDVAIERLRLSGKAGDVPAAHAAEGDAVRITTGRPLAPGGYTLDIGFSADFNAQAAGLYRMQVDGAWYSFTQFEAADARGAFPCWDEPEFKNPFQVTLVVPKDHLAIGNTPIESERVEGDQKTVAFERTPPLPTYLLAIATGPLETVALRGMSVPGRVVTVRGSAGLAQEAARVTPVLVAALEKYFGIPYPYHKLDVLAVPEFWAGAMENAAAITFKDSVLLIDPGAISVDQRRGLVLVTAHELAHMWFGDLVTMQWWDDLWLNESFASWMGDRIADQEFPEFKAELAQVLSMQTAMTTDAHLSTRAMRQPVEGVENLDQLADELTYDKGQAVLMMFERWLGPQTFRKGVVDYLKAHRWGNATAADLSRSLSKAAGKDVGGPMATFLDQPGVPLVRAEILPGGRVRLSQQRFLNYGTKTPRPVTWQIPVILKYSNGRTTRTLTLMLADASRTVTLDGSSHVAWLHPNAGESGYYRWQVAPQMLSALADAAPKALGARERIGYLGNLSALLDAGPVKGDDYLRLLGRFASDPEPEVVQAVLGGLAKVKRAFVVAGVKDEFVAYVRSTLSPALERIGRKRAESEDPSVSSLRPDLLWWLGEEGRDESVLGDAERMARAGLAEPTSIDPTIADVAAQLAALRGDMALFKQYRDRFEKARVPAERERYLVALGSFRKPEVVDAALAYSLDGPLRPQELLSIAHSIAGAPEYRQLAWDWMTTNFKTISGRVPPNYGIDLVQFADGCSTDLLDSARAFFSIPEHDLPGVSTELAKVADDVHDCVALRQREQPAVAAFLHRQAAVAGSPDPPATMTGSGQLYR